MARGRISSLARVARFAFPMALTLAAACAGQPLAALCDGKPVTQRAVLLIDSVSRTGHAFDTLRGRGIPLTLRFWSDGEPDDHSTCDARSGSVHFDGIFPAPLARAVNREHLGRWHTERGQVTLQLNPGVADNNIAVWLGLDMPAGGWDYSTFAGRTVWGRVSMPAR
jgi:hypothetical protein